MTMIVCNLRKCVHNKLERCKCTTIGMGKEGCDSFLELPTKVEIELKALQQSMKAYRERRKLPDA